MKQNIQSWWLSPYRSEPSIDDMLNDPIVHLVMVRDNIHQDDVKRLMLDVAARLSRMEKQAA